MQIMSNYNHDICVFLFIIGPRFVLNLIRIFDDSFGGATLYENPKYMTPTVVSVYDWLISLYSSLVSQWNGISTINFNLPGICIT